MTSKNNVPEDVLEWANFQLTSYTCEPARKEAITRIKRLLDQTIPAFTWNELLNLEKKHPEFKTIEAARIAVLAPDDWHYVPRSSKKEAFQSIKKIAEHAEALSDLIKAKQNELEFWTGADLDINSIILRSNEQGDDFVRQQIYLTEIEDTGLSRYIPPITDILSTLSRAIRSRVTTENSLLRPTKANAESAARTYTILRLSSYFRTRTGKPRNNLIAELLSTVLNDASLTENDVSKLSGYFTTTDKEDFKSKPR